METQTRRKYDTAFKKQAVKLSMEEGRTVVNVAEGQIWRIHKDLIVESRLYSNRCRKHFANGWESPAEHERNWCEIQKMA